MNKKVMYAEPDQFRTVKIRIDYCSNCRECPFSDTYADYCGYYDSKDFTYEDCELWYDFNNNFEKE